MGLVRKCVRTHSCWILVCVSGSMQWKKKGAVGYLLMALTAGTEGKSKLTHVSNTSTRQDRGRERRPRLDSQQHRGIKA